MFSKKTSFQKTNICSSFENKMPVKANLEEPNEYFSILEKAKEEKFDNEEEDLSNQINYIDDKPLRILNQRVEKIKFPHVKFIDFLNMKKSST